MCRLPKRQNRGYKEADINHHISTKEAMGAMMIIFKNKGISRTDKKHSSYKDSNWIKESKLDI